MRDKFSDIMILAHAIPFVREFIANITNRLPIPALVLAFINTHLLLTECLERSAPPVDRPSYGDHIVERGAGDGAAHLDPSFSC
ncbi:MAG TPA: hypothetical protein PKC67_03295 [Kiritimatiellia bacterium]|mgnify:CR=1 FL=1|nr:hypothetical protein [Kiritimatiellia bacterium]HMP33352.1 hypothetical protein [Kiritimatiellia bacterium]